MLREQLLMLIVQEGMLIVQVLKLMIGSTDVDSTFLQVLMLCALL